MNNTNDTLNIQLRPIRLTNDEYAELKKIAQKANKSVAAYVTDMLRNVIREVER